MRKRKAVDSISDEEDDKDEANTQPNADGESEEEVDHTEDEEDEKDGPGVKAADPRGWDMRENDNQYTLELERWERDPSFEAEWLTKVRQAPFMTQKDSEEWWSQLLAWWNTVSARPRDCNFISVVEAAWGKPADWLTCGEFEKTKRQLKQIELRYSGFSIPRLNAALKHTSFICNYLSREGVEQIASIYGYAFPLWISDEMRDALHDTRSLHAHRLQSEFQMAGDSYLVKLFRDKLNEGCPVPESYLLSCIADHPHPSVREWILLIDPLTRDRDFYYGVSDYQPFMLRCLSCSVGSYDLFVKWTNKWTARATEADDLSRTVLSNVLWADQPNGILPPILHLIGEYVGYATPSEVRTHLRYEIQPSPDTPVLRALHETKYDSASHVKKWNALVAKTEANWSLRFRCALQWTVEHLWMKSHFSVTLFRCLGHLFRTCPWLSIPSKLVYVRWHSARNFDVETKESFIRMLNETKHGGILLEPVNTRPEKIAEIASESTSLSVSTPSETLDYDDDTFCTFFRLPFNSWNAGDDLRKELITANLDLYRKWTFSRLVTELCIAPFHAGTRLKWSNISLLLDLMEWYNPDLDGWPMDYKIYRLFSDICRRWTASCEESLHKATRLGTALRIRELAMQSCSRTFISSVRDLLAEIDAESELNPTSYRSPFQAFSRLLDPTLLDAEYKRQSNAENEARLADPAYPFVEQVPERTWDFSDPSWKYLPILVPEKKRTLVFEFEHVIASLMEGEEICKMDEAWKAADIKFVTTSSRMRVIPSPADLLKPNVQTKTNSTRMDVETAQTKTDSTQLKVHTVQTDSNATEVETAQTKALTRSQIAQCVDLATGSWQIYDSFPIFVRKGFKELVQKSYAAGYELVLFSRRSDYKTNNAMHFIDPDYKFFPHSHRFYFHQNQHKCRFDRLGRNAEDVIIISSANDHAWDTDVPLNFIQLKTCLGLPWSAGTALNAGKYVFRKHVEDDQKANVVELERLWSKVLEPLSRGKGPIHPDSLSSFSAVTASSSAAAASSSSSAKLAAAE